MVPGPASHLQSKQEANSQRHGDGLDNEISKKTYRYWYYCSASLFRAVEANRKLPTSWGELKVERQNQP